MPGKWKDALVDIDRAVEFSGDDVDQYSKLVDLGGDFNKVLVTIPTITESVVGIAVQETNNPAEVPVIVNILDRDATGHFAQATTAGTAGMNIVFDIGGAQFIRIKCGSNQAADRTFRVRGC
jgi:hypothetical protein